MKHTYIDITQLIHWPGKLTGIPRVMHELLVRYKSVDSTSFVTWDRQTNSFYEVDIDESISRRGEGIFYKTILSEGEAAASSLLSTKNKAVRTIKKAGHQLKKYSPGLYNGLAARFHRTILAAQGKVMAIKPGDELFVLWGEWADELYRRAVIDIHSRGVSLVHVVYDMLPILAPHYSGHSEESMYVYYREVLPLSRLVLSISESTKRDLEKWLKQEGLPVPAIRTFRLGDDFSVKESQIPNQQLLKNTKPEQYILCVGTIEARKNHTLLYYVYKLAKERDIKLPKMIVVGRRGWRSDDMYSIINDDPQTKDLFVFMTDTSDEELSWLYQNCLFTIYPSFYEGWGLPVAESIIYGKTCLAARTSSIPEIAGDLVDYFDPASTDECLSMIEKLLIPDNLANAEKRISRYKKTTWDDTFQQVQAHIKEKYVK